VQKTKEMFFNASNLGLNVESTPPTTHMHLYLNREQNPRSK
jgi:hypothetical protein